MNPIVSIVTPTYNQAKFLRECIESVLAQAYPGIEYCVINDGSTDETQEILDAYRGRVLVASHPNQGQTSTINRGWAGARGQILAWLNSDDTLLPDAVGWAVEFLSSHPDTDIVFGDTLFTDGEGQLLHRSRELSGFDYERFVLECENPIPQPSAFVRRSVIEEAGPLDPSYQYFMDWEFWLRAGIRHRITYSNHPLSTYRLHQASKTVSRPAQVAPELERMYAEYFAREDVPLRLVSQRRRACANMWFTTAGYFSQGGDSRAARRCGLNALRAYPSTLGRPGMLHKLLFSLFGSSRLYRLARAVVRPRL